MKTILAFFILMMMTITVNKAQTAVIETFSYDAGAADGLGEAANGWGGPWTFVGATENVNIEEGSLEFADMETSGNKLVINALEGTDAGASRMLEATWEDVAGKEYWISFLFEVTNPTGIMESWQGMSLDLGGEQAYIGKLWAMDELGINDPNPYLNVPSTYLWSDGIAWLVTKIVMSGDENVDTAYLWINPDPSIKPGPASANVRADITLNDGFNAIRCHMGQTTGLVSKFDEIRLGTAWSDVTPVVTGLSEVEKSGVPACIYPNPFSDVTTINFTLPSAETVTLEIFDMAGNKIETLVNRLQSEGEHNITWNAVDQPAGIYFYKLSAGALFRTGKLMLQK